MTTAEIVSISIAFVSLLVSVLTVYFTYLKPTRLRMLTGRILIIANTYLETETGKQWGGLSFILPFTFSNWSPKGGSIYQTRVAIGRESNRSKYFDLTWSSFITFVDGTSSWESDAIAHPLAIQAQSSLTKFIRFDWSPLRGEKISIQEGQYNLKFYAWTNDQTKPQIKQTITFHLTQKQVDKYNDSVNNNLVIPIIVNLGQSSLPNRISTLSEISSMYEN
ncbi:MAG: hypothetical protein AAGA80_03950 [Cyanobacteria bacterium P01_F01_bin.143]